MEHLIIRNFGPVTDIDIVLKKINVFIGEQGVGKSTIAKLLSCLRDVSLYDVILTKRENREQIIERIFSIYGIQGCFRSDTYIEYFNGTDISLIYESGAFRITSSECSEDELRDIVSNVMNGCLMETFKNLGIETLGLSQEELSKLMAKHHRVLASNLRLSFYCPAERGIVGALSNSMASLFMAQVPLPDTLMEYMSFFEKAKNHFKSYDLPFLHSKYMLEDGVDSVKCGDCVIPLRYASSGMQSIIPLLMIIDYCVSENYFHSFTIEEPELNLFPSNQLELIRQILSKTNSEKCKVGTWTLTTHSPYILSILNISLLAGLIADKYPEAADALAEKLPADNFVMPDEIAVYSLEHTAEGKSDCRDILDRSTGLIQANYLDTVSDLLSGEFNGLYKLYLSLLRNSK